ncbi:hypothetical protein SKAU_G00402470 [Synaphobranchus kaupii]|uniref:Uncharacterized protein n=1 Tax=Synaphobranchus kaupii TaxID=118154 RepID=A0A9Q1E9A7_SYNKA|nr:hypothetical protein SKAU_G00402470 [Synaphobranchus kaupii]
MPGTPANGETAPAPLLQAAARGGCTTPPYGHDVTAGRGARRRVSREGRRPRRHPRSATALFRLRLGETRQASTARPL